MPHWGFSPTGGWIAWDPGVVGAHQVVHVMCALAAVPWDPWAKVPDGAVRSPRPPAFPWKEALADGALLGRRSQCLLPVRKVFLPHRPPDRLLHGAHSPAGWVQRRDDTIPVVCAAPRRRLGPVSAPDPASLRVHARGCVCVCVCTYLYMCMGA